MTIVASFHVDGVPAPKGSARAVTNRHTGKAVLLASASPKNARDQKSWAESVAWMCKAAMAGRPPVTGPVLVRIEFYLPRPKTVKAKRPTAKRDGDKLLRCTWDAMTGLAYVDDGQIVEWPGGKHFADGCQPGARITIETIT